MAAAVRKKAKSATPSSVEPRALEALIQVLRANGVRAFKGYGIELLIDGAEPTFEFAAEESVEDGEEQDTISDLYQNPALWGGKSPPSID